VLFDMSNSTRTVVVCDLPQDVRPKAIAADNTIRNAHEKCRIDSNLSTPDHLQVASCSAASDIASEPAWSAER
jgi:hypothetical protein